jgi:hypothetical protein
VPLPLLPVVGAAVAAGTLPLLVVEDEAELESADAVVLSAVLDELGEALPA